MNEELKIEVAGFLDEAREGVQRLRSLHCQVARASLLKKADLAEQAAAESLAVLDSMVEAISTIVGGLTDG
jgi:hypothetical protein